MRCNNSINSSNSNINNAILDAKSRSALFRGRTRRRSLRPIASRTFGVGSFNSRRISAPPTDVRQYSAAVSAIRPPGVAEIAGAAEDLPTSVDLPTSGQLRRRLPVIAGGSRPSRVRRASLRQATATAAHPVGESGTSSGQTGDGGATATPSPRRRRRRLRVVVAKATVSPSQRRLRRRSRSAPGGGQRSYST